MGTIKWGTIIPLIGGMAVGNAKAFGSKPEWAVSFKGFENNNRHFRNYWSDVPFHHIVDDGSIPDLTWLKPVDVVTTVCPCAGLSMLNCASDGKKARGCNALQNGWMYLTTEAVLRYVKPKVLMGENAPGLFTKAGTEVRERLCELAESYGYSVSFMKTDTYLHGIPQHRIRTFYFFWKSDTAPVLNYRHSLDVPPLVDYLKQIPTDAPNQIEINPSLSENTTLLYMKKMEGDNWRQALLDHNRHAWGYITKHNLYDDFISFCESRGGKQDLKYIERANYIRNKLSINPETGKPYGGYWNDSVLYYGKDAVNAVIGKNVHLTVHPTEDRSFTIRELLWLMGHPHDFELLENKHIYTIFQNVPSCTAYDWSDEIVKFLNDELQASDAKVLMQNNIKKQRL